MRRVNHLVRGEASLVHSPTKKTNRSGKRGVIDLIVSFRVLSVLIVLCVQFGLFLYFRPANTANKSLVGIPDCNSISADAIITKPPERQKEASSIRATAAERENLHASVLLKEPREEILNRARSWIRSIQEHYDRSQHEDVMKKYGHVRFFPFSPLASCKDIQEIGRTATNKRKFNDDSKQVCGLSQQENLQDPNCIIYSIGGNNQWSFENELLALTKCHIHTFDCTGAESRFHVPKHSRLSFHHKCLGSEQVVWEKRNCETVPQSDLCGPLETLEQLQKELGHTRLDLLKIDIEGYEVNLLRKWWSSHMEGSHRMTLPNQILMELHYRSFATQFKQLASPYLQDKNNEGPAYLREKVEFVTTVDLVTLNKMLIDMGYVVVSREDNPPCKHCTELVLLRIADRIL